MAEGRGESIVVGVRVRPLSESEAAAGEEDVWEVAADADNTLRLMARERVNIGGACNYHFDRVFGPATASDAVYKDVARPLVDSALHGMNATLFAYGQTGSGKTYTMQSITRDAADHIFRHVEATKNKQYIVKVAAMEIYNEVVKDLLVGEDGAGLRILDDPERGPVVEGLNEIGVTSRRHLEELLCDIESKRQVAETRLNAFSSRSHTIVRLYLECSERHSNALPIAAQSETEESESECDIAAADVIVSTINFVDLAGSERSSIAGSQDNDDRQRLKEGCHINRSLLTLGTVIRNLGDPIGKKHVPYRDSRLTRILQPSLSGNARMAIICTINPSLRAVEMTRAALHFATCAKSVQMRPQINKVVDSRAQIKQMKREIATLRKKLKAYESGSTIEAFSLELEKKDAQIMSTTQSRDALQKRLWNLEKLLLATPNGSTLKRRASFDDAFSSPLSTARFEEEDNDFVALDRTSLSTFYRRDFELFSPCHGTDSSRRFHADSGQRTDESSDIFGSMRHSIKAGWLSCGVGRRLSSVDDSFLLSSICSRTERPNISDPTADIMKNDQCGQDEEATAALVALQNEVRCIKHGVISTEEDTSAKLNSMKSLLEDAEASSEGRIGKDLFDALKSELCRLERSFSASNSANRAVDALEEKIKYFATDKGGTSKLLDESKCQEHPDENNDEAKEHRQQQIEGNDLNAERKRKRVDGSRGGLCCEISFSCRSGGSASLKLKASASLRKRRSKSSERNNTNQKNEDIKDQSDDTTSSKPADFAALAHEDLSQLRDCLIENRKELDRLECQKKMLLKQVLHLESRLKDEISNKEAVEDRNRSMKEELNTVRDANRRLRRHLMTDLCPIPGAPLVGAEGMLEHDSWAETPTVETMLPKIVQLWEELHVPLRRRSRFYLAFRGSELFYYEAEHRKLTWEKNLLTNADSKEAGSSSSKGPARSIKRASKRLENERKWLATQLKFEFGDETRQELYRQWGIPIDAKERKLKLIRKLWSPETVRKPNGMERSASLVVQLLGGDDFPAGALDLIFRAPSSGDDSPIVIPQLFSHFSRRFSRRSSSRCSDTTASDL